MKNRLSLIFSLTIIGAVCIFCGFAFGENIAASLPSSSPNISSGKFMACIYTPIIIGIYFLISSLILLKGYCDNIF